MDEVLGAALDEFEPDLVHCHDVHFIAIVAAHVARARHRGRDPRWVYDAHELVEGLWPAAARSAAMVAAWADVEDQVIGRADAVVTVSPDLAAVLERHHDLSRTPTVVLNAPDLRTASGRGGRTVRDAAGLGIDVPLLVYGGGLTEGRGVETVIDGLEYLPGVHLAIICVPSPDAPYAQHLAAFAAEHGVADRVHLVPPVPPQEVCTFLRGADLGVHPMLRCGNHDIALPNKLFEYLFAGLPLVVSDVPALAGFVEERMVGRSFTAGDPRAFAVAVRRVLFDLAGFRERAGDPALVQTYCWERQADRLLGVYEEVLAR
jgi:glycosyltransferase involved in cell wall biosynthesis